MVNLIQTWGSDSLVVSMARASYGDFDLEPKDPAYQYKLVAALKRKGHWVPFSHCGATLKIKAPIFVARQLVKHTVGLTWSEESKRYTSVTLDVYVPERIKKMSSEVVALYTKMQIDAFNNYEKLLSLGVPKELARASNTVATPVQWYWTGTLAAWQRVFEQRLDSAAQVETREVVAKCKELLVTIFPLSLS